ncbi:MAG: chlorite dismutase family protein [Pseudomonadota bacterium]
MQTPSTPPPRLFHFLGGSTGPWRVDQHRVVIGEDLSAVTRLAISAEPPRRFEGSGWSLRGITSNERYVERDEKAALVSRQEGLGRPTATHAALIPIRKTPEWWALTQQERREIFEAQSKHIAIGMKYLPAVARRLHHCRDLGTREPFDFITWFEYAAADAAGFEELVQALRASPEWTFVDREVDIRMVRDDT